MNRLPVRQLVWLGAAGIVVVAIIATPLWRTIQSASASVLAPLYYQTNALGNNVSLLWRVQTLAKDNDSLRHELAGATVQNAELKTLREENAQLRTLAQVPLPSGVSAIGSEIIGQHQDELNSGYVLNRGSNDGIVAGMPVVAGMSSENEKIRALLLGTIQSVSPTQSLFTLTTTNSNNVLAEVVNDTHSQGMAVGEYNLAIRLKYVPLTEKLLPGDEVVTSNLDLLTPPGLLIGTISTVEQQEGDFYVSAIVAPPQPLDKFKFVYILKRQ